MGYMLNIFLIYFVICECNGNLKLSSILYIKVIMLLFN